MRANMRAGAASDLTSEAGFDRGAGLTRALLRLGVLAGPFYLALGLAQALLRDGFDLMRHPLSLLANGPGGWVQTANFVLSGLMVIAAGVGFARALGPGARTVSWFLGAFGASMLAAAVFPADPVDGFPVGTPAGLPTSISTTGLIHFAAGALGFVSLGVSCLFAARAMSRRSAPGLARLSFACGVVVVLGFVGGAAAGPAGILGIWISVLAGWAWLAVMSLHLTRESAQRHSSPR